MSGNRPAIFGEMLQRHRIAAGLTQEELAERARLSARAISDLERGARTRPHLATVRQLAEALQLSDEETGTLQLAARHRLHSEGGSPLRLGSGEPAATGVEPMPEGMQRLPIGGFLGSLPSGALVAREEELARICGAVQQVASDEGRLVLLAGEPGIGKTRLAQELTRAVCGCGFVVAAGRCYEPQQSVPYYPFLDALGMAYAAAPATVRDGASRRWPYLARLLPDQLGVAMAPRFDSPEEQERLFRAVTGFLQAIGEVNPVALMLDDLHWADSASLQLLQHLARQTRASRILLLGTYRDVEVHPQHPLETTLRDLNREQLVERVVLKRLGEPDTVAFITETMGELEAGAELAALVHRHTDGNPFFTQQVLQALVESGSIYRQDGQWKRRAIQEIEVPESVRSVIAQRVSRLPPEAQEMLQEASVLGPAFTFGDLLAMKSSFRDAADLEDALDAALADAASFQLVRLTGKDGYAFDHALTQQALYATLSPRRQRRLHLAAGEALEQLPERSKSRRAAELAWHFLQGDDAGKAIQYSLLAGDQAESVFAHGEAERQYRVALEMAEETGDRHQEEALEKLGVALKITGRHEEALDVLERAARMCHEASDLEGEGRVVAHIGSLWLVRGAPEEGISRLQPLASTLEERGPSRSLALLYAELVRLFGYTGRETNQFHARERLLALARGLQDERLLTEAELHQGVYLTHVGRHEEALQVLESAIPRAESLGDFHTLCTALDFASFAHHARREVDQARIYRERAVEVAEQLGDPREISYRAAEAAIFTFVVGDWSHSRLYAERAVTSALQMNSLRLLILPLCTLGEACLYVGDLDEASNYLQECVTIAEHLRLYGDLREVQALLAEKDLLQGDPGAALDRLRPLLDTPGWEEDLNFLLALAATRLAAGDFTGAEEPAAKALVEASRQGLPVGVADALRVQGSIAAQQGQWEEAESRFQRAVQLARDITYPWGEARALYEHGLLAARRGEPDRARDQLQAASAIFQRLGAEPYRLRADRATEALSRLEHGQATGTTLPQPPR